MLYVVKYEDNNWDRRKNIYSFFDINGKLIWESDKGINVTIDQYGNRIVLENEKYGLLDKNFQLLFKPSYKRLQAVNNEFFVASNNDDGYGIIDYNNKVLLDFIFIKIFNFETNHKVIVEDQQDIYRAFDLNNKLLTVLPFDKIFYASSNSYNAPSPSNQTFFKSLIDCKVKNHVYEQHEILKYRGKWGIIHSDGIVKIPNEYNYIDFLRNPEFFKVCKGDLQYAYEGGVEIIKNAKWGIIDKNNNIIVPIEYDWIDEVESTLWAVYKGGVVYYNDDFQEDYWTIKGAKLGVYNMENLIVPIEYDTIQLSWFRVKDFIFVHKKAVHLDESDYDVYTFQGEKIEENKPSPKNHLNNA